jgi:hypothetical protein
MSTGLLRGLQLLAGTCLGERFPLSSFGFGVGLCSVVGLPRAWQVIQWHPGLHPLDAMNVFLLPATMPVRNVSGIGQG